MKNSKMIFMIVAGFSMNLVAQDDSGIVKQTTEAIKNAGNVVVSKISAFGNSAKESYIAQANQEDANDKAKPYVSADSIKNVVTVIKESFITQAEQEDAQDKAKTELFKNAITTPVVKEATTSVAPTLYERTKTKLNEIKDLAVNSMATAYTYTNENRVLVGSVATGVVLTAAAITYYVYQQSDVDNDTEVSNS